MKSVLHWDREAQGSWEFSPRWLLRAENDLDEIEIPDEVFERYKAAEEAYEKACNEVGKAMLESLQQAEAKRLPYSLKCWFQTGAEGLKHKFL